ncbi:MAG: hypothetical protein WCY23_01455 [Candidatus Omnitrophota bacterium]
MRFFAVIVLAAFFASCAPSGAASPGADIKAFNIYTEKTAKDNHFFPSGWMGDFGDIKLDAGCKDQPHSGANCVKITYSAEQKQGAGWCGMYWQNPPNNWGTEPGGFDLTGATKLVFWAKGAKGGEKIAEFKTGGITGEFADSDTVSIENIVLTPEWKEYSIDLKGANLSHISGGFCWSASASDNPDGFTMYLDDIYFEKAQ